MRVCHLGKYYRPAIGGIESHVRTLAQAQVSLGADVHVLCIDHDGEQATRRRDAGDEWDGDVRVTRVPRRASLARFDYCPGLSHSLQRLIDNSYDIVHLHVPNPTFLLALSAMRLRVPLVVSYHSDIIRQRLLSKGLAPFQSRVFDRASRVLATSHAYIEGSRWLQRYAYKVDLLPHAIDLAPFLHPSPAARQFADRLRTEHGEPLWLSVGRLVYYKGLNVAIDALRHVEGKLCIIGSGPLERALCRHAESLSLQNRILWLGHVNDEEKVGAYLAATALWFPSNARSEATGIVQIEAMASGCPVINANIPHSGVPWVSRDQETGFTVPVNDAAAFASAAAKLLAEPSLRSRFGEAAVQRVTSEFSDTTMAERSLAIYDEVRQETRKSRARDVSRAGV